MKGRIRLNCIIEVILEVVLSCQWWSFSIV